MDELIPSLVIDTENAFLIGIPFIDDIHNAMIVMDVTLASGPDDFSGRFYQCCWEVVGRDVVFVVQDFSHI